MTRLVTCHGLIGAGTLVHTGQFIFEGSYWIPSVLISVGAAMIVGSGYLKIKNSKNCSGSGLRNPKKGGYEVGVGVCD
jgi:hypothetical protein